MSTDDGSYIRAYYQVPAEVGGRIVFDGNPGVITGFFGQYLLAEIDDLPGGPAILHPTWRVEYVFG